jgi:[acyl-carrier-protein] S-malonyltransferase
MPTPPTFDVSDAALAFRGYNVTNLGRTRELLHVPAYGEIVWDELRRYSAVCQAIIRRPCDLVELVKQNVELELDRYAESIALIVAAEAAQLRLLREVHGVDYARAKLAFGYSLGEMAVCCGGAFAAEELVRVPLAMAADCADLARDVEMGILFSRGGAISEHDVRRLCADITRRGRGTIGLSAILSPNSYLIIGQGYTVDLFKEEMKSALPAAAHLRINEHRWPPLHTPIVRQRHVVDRAALMIDQLQPGTFPPTPPVFSLATGKRNYDEHAAREVLRQWIDHPQRLWDAVVETLNSGVGTVIHVGPEPNLILATFARVAENVKQQTNGKTLDSYRMKAMSGLASRPWLANLLPKRAALLRAPQLKHIVLEDWLMEHAPAAGGVHRPAAARTTHGRAAPSA